MSKSIAPTFYTKFFTHFPKLTIINLQETILDNESFNSIGETCHLLKELNASGSTITDTGLQYLSYSISDKGTLRLASKNSLPYSMRNVHFVL